MGSSRKTNQTKAPIDKYSKFYSKTGVSQKDFMSLDEEQRKNIYTGFGRVESGTQKQNMDAVSAYQKYINDYKKKIPSPNTPKPNVPSKAPTSPSKTSKPGIKAKDYQTQQLDILKQQAAVQKKYYEQQLKQQQEQYKVLQDYQTQQQGLFSEYKKQQEGELALVTSNQDKYIKALNEQKDYAKQLQKQQQEYTDKINAEQKLQADYQQALATKATTQAMEEDRYLGYQMANNLQTSMARQRVFARNRSIRSSTSYGTGSLYR